MYSIEFYLMFNRSCLKIEKWLIVHFTIFSTFLKNCLSAWINSFGVFHYSLSGRRGKHFCRHFHEAHVQLSCIYTFSVILCRLTDDLQKRFEYEYLIACILRLLLTVPDKICASQEMLVASVVLFTFSPLE